MQKAVCSDVSPVIYIGPSLPHGRLNKNTIFSCSKEKAIKCLAEIIESYPSVAKLIVPLRDLPRAKAKLEGSSGYLSKAYAEVQVAAIKNKEV